MGFTTRSDIGPARPTVPSAVSSDTIFGQAPVGYVAGRGRGMGELARTQGELLIPGGDTGDQDRADYSESNYDEFSGYGGERLFAGQYEEDDAEADNIYRQVDDAMEKRRKRSREQQQLALQQKNKLSGVDRPRIADQFADLKRELGTVTAEQWDAIPEVGDHSLKLKQSRKKETTFTPLPDYLLAGGTGLANNVAGDASVLGTQSTISGLAAEARGSALSSKLDKMSDSVTGITTSNIS